MHNTHGNQRVSDDRILEEFRKADDPFLTATELGESLSMTRQGVNQRLRELAERDLLKRKQCGSGVGWWLPEA